MTLYSELCDSILQYINGHNKPDWQQDEDIKDKQDENNKDKQDEYNTDKQAKDNKDKQTQQDDKEDENSEYEQDKSFIRYMLNEGMEVPLQFLKEQPVCADHTVEVRRQELILLLEGLVESKTNREQNKKRDKENKNEEDDEENVEVKLLYAHNLQFSKWSCFFPPYDWSEVIKEEKKEYLEQKRNNRALHQQFLAFCSNEENEENEENKEKEENINCWFMGTRFYQTSNELTQWLCAQESLQEVPTVLCQMISDYLCFPKSMFVQPSYYGDLGGEEVGFYKLSWFEDPRKFCYWSIKFDKGFFHSQFNVMKIKINANYGRNRLELIDATTLEIGGCICDNQISQVILVMLQQTQPEMQSQFNSHTDTYAIRKYLIQLLVRLSSPLNLFNVMCNKDRHKQQLPEEAMRQIKLEKSAYETLSSPLCKPWLMDCMTRKRRAVCTPLLIFNQMVEYGTSYSQQVSSSSLSLSSSSSSSLSVYRFDAGKSSYRSGKFLYWALSVVWSTLSTLISDQTHPLHLCFDAYISNDFERNADKCQWYSHGGIVCKNELTLLIIEWLTYSNSMLQEKIGARQNEQMINEHMMSVYRQSFIEFLDNIVD